MMNMMQKKTLVLAVAIAMATACEAEQTSDAVSVAADGTVTELSREHKSTADLAILALADHLDIPVDGIVVDSVRPVNWPDSSIGCPQPDQAYMQVITPGHKIALRVDGRSVHRERSQWQCLRLREAESHAPGSQMSRKR